MQRIPVGWAALAVLCLALCLCGNVAGQPYHYETTFVGVNIPVGGANCGVVSVQETFPGGLAGKFIDYTSVAGDVPATNTAAALDMNVNFRPPYQHPNPLWGQIYPTGELAIARSQGVNGGNVIAFYQPWNGDLNWQTRQYANFGGPQGPTWTIPTQTGSPVMAMEIANGFPLNNGIPLAPSDYLITAEIFQGFIFLGAYALTNGAGAIVQPALVGATPTNLPGTVVGMAIAVGNINPATGERTQNEIVFAVHYTQVPPPFNNTIWLHSITFDTRTAAFGQLDVGTAYATPFPLSAATGGSVSFGGISIARNYQSTFFGGFTHDVAVSMGNVNNPNGLPGDVFIFQPNPAAPPQPLQFQGIGGSHICHVPGADVVGGQYWGTANATFNFPPIGGPPPGPFGWFVVTPGAQYSIAAIDGAGAPSGNFFYFYPQGATPNGPPMSHPGGQSVVPLFQLRPGPLWIPYVLGGVPAIDFVESQFVWNGPAGAVPHTVAAQNFVEVPPLPALLKPNQPWPVNATLRGVAFLNEYGLYLRGY